MFGGLRITFLHLTHGSVVVVEDVIDVYVPNSPLPLLYQMH